MPPGSQDPTTAGRTAGAQPAHRARLLLALTATVKVPLLTHGAADQRALVDLAKQEERRPEQSVQVSFSDQDEQAQGDGSKNPGRER